MAQTHSSLLIYTPIFPVRSRVGESCFKLATFLLKPLRPSCNKLQMNYSHDETIGWSGCDTTVL
eukprot:scaffold13756_cov97-Cylindrotheca_fusiformis.AAC.2